jgi:hypothetical protein
MRGVIGLRVHVDRGAADHDAGPDQSRRESRDGKRFP